MSERKMPDRVKDDYSNAREVVEQFRKLGYGDTYILETLLSVIDAKNNVGLWNWDKVNAPSE